MKLQILFIIYLFSLILCRESNAIIYITFSNQGISVSGEGASVSGTTVTIEEKGTYLAQGNHLKEML